MKKTVKNIKNKFKFLSPHIEHFPFVERKNPSLQLLQITPSQPSSQGLSISPLYGNDEKK